VTFIGTATITKIGRSRPGPAAHDRREGYVAAAVSVLSELAELPTKAENFDAKITVLIENVRHHVEEEEQEWFPEV
jgi:hypothetical protein